jgi:hypothetical protein
MADIETVGIRESIVKAIKEKTDNLDVLLSAIKNALASVGADKIVVLIADSSIMVPTDIQNRYKAPLMLYSGTVTANGNSGDIDVSPYSVLEIEIKVTGVSGTNPTLDVYIEGKFEGTGDYKTLASQTGITAAGIWFFTINPNAFRYIRVRWVVGGTSPSFTFRVDAQGMV